MDFGTVNKRKLRNRLLFFGGIIFTAFFLFVLHLFNLQIVENLVWEGKARAVAQRSEPLPSQRGLIWDRNYDVPLAVNSDSYSIQIVPAEITPLTPESLSKKLAETLDVDRENILHRLPSKWENVWFSIEVLDGLSYTDIVRIAESSEEFPGVKWQRKPSRQYRETGAISHVSGYVGNISTEELQVLYNRGYTNTASLGKSGIEKAYDGILRGKEGKLFRTVDVSGRYLDEEGTEALSPENGQDIVLTIDRHIQTLAEKALGPRKGTLIVLKPATGEILALVSYPSFDPNNFAKSGPGSFKNLSENKDFPFLNRALQASYSPASTFKLIMTAAILGENAFDPAARINCRGSMRLGNRVFWCHKRSGHGPQDLQSALANSCNIYFGKIGVEYLGIDEISRYARAFGLGSVTGIELDGEKTGLVPGKAWKEEVYDAAWNPGDTLNSSIGQGFFLVTPLQMANVAAAIANRGTVYRPHLLKEIRKPSSGLIVEQTQPEILRTIDLLEDRDYNILQSAMRRVITAGTGKFAVYTNSVQVVGKTGTGEIGYGDRWNDWFVSYAPYRTNNPEERIVVVVMIEAADTYDWWAPKAADIVFEGVFGHKTYEEIINLWRERKIWWSWSDKDIPKPGWPYIPKKKEKKN